MSMEQRQTIMPRNKLFNGINIFLMQVYTLYTWAQIQCNDVTHLQNKNNNNPGLCL